MALTTVLLDGLIFFPIVWLPYMYTGLVDNYPTLIVCGFVAMAALMSFFNGMVLDSIKQKERREFEFRLSLLYELENMYPDHIK